MANSTAPKASPIQQPWSVRMADSVMHRHSPLSDRWKYEAGVVLQGIEHVWQTTHNSRYWQYLKANVDHFCDPQGNIRTYEIQEYNLDQIKSGTTLFTLYRETRDERYKRAAFLLRDQLRTHPRTHEGGFWHKQIYPYQMWLDGIYMAEPFYATFAETFDEPAIFDDVANQILWIEQHTRDPQTGLLYHAWDESKQQLWANHQTGHSPHFWGRAMGWYVMALVDVLEHFPTSHSARARIVAILQNAVAAIARVQDPATGLWYQVLDQAHRMGNYREASASCMFVYALVKGVRQGYLDPKYLNVARQGYAGIVNEFVSVDAQGWVSLYGICGVAGLGGKPYRDGSYEYYIGEPLVVNDYKGVGAFMLASDEIEKL